MSERTKPPSLRLYANEALAIPKVVLAPLRRPSKFDPFGEGRPVMVVPGMLSNDMPTALLRASLKAADFKVHGWGDGINGRVSEERLARVGQRIQNLKEQAGQPLILVGWSLGGLYSRVLAHRHPEAVSLVMTLGSPFSGDRRANNAWRLYERLNDHSVDAPPFPEDVSAKPEVPTVAMWSPRDGIIAPECARGLAGESDRQVELPYRHIELACSRRAIGEVLTALKTTLEEVATLAT